MDAGRTQDCVRVEPGSFCLTAHCRHCNKAAAIHCISILLQTQSLQLQLQGSFFFLLVLHLILYDWMSCSVQRLFSLLPGPRPFCMQLSYHHTSLWRLVPCASHTKPANRQTWVLIIQAQGLGEGQGRGGDRGCAVHFGQRCLEKVPACQREGGRGEGPVTDAGLRSQGSLLVQLDLFTHITARSLRDPG